MNHSGDIVGCLNMSQTISVISEDGFPNKHDSDE